MKFNQILDLNEVISSPRWILEWGYDKKVLGILYLNTEESVIHHYNLYNFIKSQITSFTSVIFMSKELNHS